MKLSVYWSVSALVTAVHFIVLSQTAYYSESLFLEPGVDKWLRLKLFMHDRQLKQSESGAS